MSDNPTEQAPNDKSKVWGLDYWEWAIVFCVAMFAAVAVNRFGLVPAPAGKWLQFAPLVLVVPMANAQMKLFARHGVSSPALTRYNRNMLLTLGAFVVCFGAAVYLSREFKPSGAAALGGALLAVAPVIGIIWTVARYLREETDEFLRHKAMGALLISLFFVLLVGSLWGALQMFGLTPKAVNWWVLPAWGFGLGIGNLWQWTRNR